MEKEWTEKKARRERIAAVLLAGFNANQNCYRGYSVEYDRGKTETWLYNGWPTLGIALEQADWLIKKIDEGE